jgi:hypothetical protein
VRARSGHEHDGDDVRGGQEQRAEDDRRLHPTAEDRLRLVEVPRRRMAVRLGAVAAEDDRQLGERGDGEPERDGLEEVVLVEADRLRDELPDRTLLGGERRGQRRRPTRGTACPAGH